MLQPLIFLGGVFYSAALLPEPFQTLTHFNPVYYMIGLVRYGFLGYSETNIALSLVFLLAAALVLFALNCGCSPAATGCARLTRRLTWAMRSESVRRQGLPVKTWREGECRFTNAFVILLAVAASRCPRGPRGRRRSRARSSRCG